MNRGSPKPKGWCNPRQHHLHRTGGAVEISRMLFFGTQPLLLHTRQILLLSKTDFLMEDKSLLLKSAWKSIHSFYTVQVFCGLPVSVNTSSPSVHWLHCRSGCDDKGYMTPAAWKLQIWLFLYLFKFGQSAFFCLPFIFCPGACCRLYLQIQLHRDN